MLTWSKSYASSFVNIPSAVNVSFSLKALRHELRSSWTVLKST